MSVVIVTGSAGLVGSQVARHLAGFGWDVVGIDNDMRGQLFGRDGSVAGTVAMLQGIRNYQHYDMDVRDPYGVNTVIGPHRPTLVVHCAAQPAHDSPDPRVDWDVNAGGTVNVLEAVRQHAPHALFVHLSTIKVYGQYPNMLPLTELATRYDLDLPGISETMPVDETAHGIFGASKLAADVMVQEYGHSLGLNTVVLRPGCLTGADHAAVEAHGFLGHLVRCVATGQPYRIHGDGKQVRDQIHAHDVVTAIEQVWRDPPDPGEVFNLGGGRGTDVSVLEALALAEQVTGRAAKTEHAEGRAGDHRWWITDMAKFRSRYPGWAPERDLAAIVGEIADRWS